MLNRLLAVVLLALGLTMGQLSGQVVKVPFGTLSVGPNLPTDVLKIIPLVVFRKEVLFLYLL